MCDVRPSIADIPVHLPHDADMLIAIEQRVLFLLVDAIPGAAGMRRLVRLEAGVGEDDY